MQEKAAFWHLHLDCIVEKGCFSVLYSFPLSDHFVGFETRDHLINQKLSFTDKLLHDLADPELWKWHKDQFPNRGPAV